MVFFWLLQMEQIRRANRLFAQDSLFLREYLMIPVDRNSLVTGDEQSRGATTSASQSTGPTKAGSSKPNRDNSNDVGKQLKHLLFIVKLLKIYDCLRNFNFIKKIVLSPEEESKKSIEDFLGKIDSTLAKSKSYVRNR